MTLMGRKDFLKFKGQNSLICHIQQLNRTLPGRGYANCKPSFVVCFSEYNIQFSSCPFSTLLNWQTNINATVESYELIIPWYAYLMILMNPE